MTATVFLTGVSSRIGLALAISSGAAVNGAGGWNRGNAKPGYGSPRILAAISRLAALKSGEFHDLRTLL